MAKVYGITNGSNGYGNGILFEATGWKDGGATEPERARDLDGIWVEVVSVFVADGDEVIQDGYDFLNLIPRET